ncbi:MAG: HXXEE domain-containing protein [Oenococcus oeni]
MNIYFIFPLIFMLHELEEIAFMPGWVAKVKANKNNWLTEMIPEISAKNFTLMVLEEYILLLIITLLCWWTKNLDFYFAVILAYNLHILFHIGQAIIFKGYIPGLFLGIVSLGLASWLIWLTVDYVSWDKIFVFLPLAILIIVVNLISIHKWIHL